MKEHVNFEVDFREGMGRMIMFWILSCIYITICQLYTFLFLANVRAIDSAQWLECSAVSLVQELA